MSSRSSTQKKVRWFLIIWNIVGLVFITRAAYYWFWVAPWPMVLGVFINGEFSRRYAYVWNTFERGIYVSLIKYCGIWAYVNSLVLVGLVMNPKRRGLFFESREPSLRVPISHARKPYIFIWDRRQKIIRWFLILWNLFTLILVVINLSSIYENRSFGIAPPLLIEYEGPIWAYVNTLALMGSMLTSRYNTSTDPSASD